LLGLRPHGGRTPRLMTPQATVGELAEFGKRIIAWQDLDGRESMRRTQRERRYLLVVELKREMLRQSIHKQKSGREVKSDVGASGSKISSTSSFNLLRQAIGI